MGEVIAMLGKAYLVDILAWLETRDRPVCAGQEPCERAHDLAVGRSDMAHYLYRADHEAAAGHPERVVMSAVDILAEQRA